MKKTMLTFAFSIAYMVGIYALDTEKLIADFKSDNWETIIEAKKELENLQEVGLPQIIKLLDFDKVVKVKNTGDLIYPGAERFYGHGMIVDYDIDKIQIRAGWLLEEITFQNFGFSLIHDRDEALVNHIKVSFKEYLTQEYIKKIESMTPDQLRAELKRLAIEKAKKWWRTENEEWERLQGIIDALHSNDSRRQNLALQYLKSGQSHCKGLSIETYLDELKSRITYLSKSKINRISEQAVFIINDSDFEFIRIKSK